ncbi:MAG: response regulator [Phycisphaerales bacterium]|nr:response regulator [Phycisphaerales bacterium]
MTIVERESPSARRILLVEDNFLVGESIRRELEAMGCAVRGPVATLEQGRDIAGSERFDAAILDINIRGGLSTEIAQVLRGRSCPVVFITGYGTLDAMPPELRETRRLNKPIDRATLAAVIDDLLGECRLTDG